MRTTTCKSDPRQRPPCCTNSLALRPNTDPLLPQSYLDRPPTPAVASRHASFFALVMPFMCRCYFWPHLPATTLLWPTRSTSLDRALHSSVCCLGLPTASGRPVSDLSTNRLGSMDTPPSDGVLLASHKSACSTSAINLGRTNIEPVIVQDGVPRYSPCFCNMDSDLCSSHHHLDMVALFATKKLSDFFSVATSFFGVWSVMLGNMIPWFRYDDI